MDLKFIGRYYTDEKEKEEILESYDGFEKVKLAFINEVQQTKTTMLTYWRLYTKNLHGAELSLKKDLMYFTTDEIENILRTKFVLSQSTRRSMITFCNQYLDWGVSKGYIKDNPVHLVDKEITTKTNSKVLRNKVIDLQEFYEFADKSYQASGTLKHIIPYILCRYGVAGESCSWIINLTWEDIDKEKKVIYIREDGQLITKLPIDDEFILWLDLWYEESKITRINNEGYFGSQYVNYVLQKSVNEDSESQTQQMTSAGIQNKFNLACNAINTRRKSVREMVTSRQIDLLLELRKDGTLSTKELTKVLEITKGKANDNTRAYLRKCYTGLTGDNILSKQDMKESNLSFEEICDSINYYI